MGMDLIMTDTFFSLPDIPAANARHDQQHGDPYQFQSGRVRGGWQVHNMSRRGYLTDKQIDYYASQGFYSEEFREARRRHHEKKRSRSGNWVTQEGRLIYSPM